MARLPDTRDMPNEIVMIRTHRNAYDHALRAAGATIIDIGHNDRGTGAGVRGIEAWEIEAALGPAHGRLRASRRRRRRSTTCPPPSPCAARTACR